jgi:hypothetical protein
MSFGDLRPILLVFAASQIGTAVFAFVMGDQLVGIGLMLTAYATLPRDTP